MPQSSANNSFILFADIAGYTAIMEKDEANAAKLLQKFRTSLHNIIETHQGIINNFYGDGALCLFEDANQMFDAALALQKKFKETPIVPVRIGLHSGDVFFEEKNAFGNAINIASRIESIGKAGSITFSKRIYNYIEKEDSIQSISLGAFAFKNVTDKIEVYAVSNEGITIPKKKEIEGKLADNKTRTFPIVFGTIILMGLLFFAYNYFSPDNNTNHTQQWNQSLAVIPLKNLNGSLDQEYFSDGITQDILTNLSGIEELQVISFNSSKKYRNSEKSVQEIGNELGVKHLLLGSVQQVNQKLRVRAMLVNAENDQQIWAKSYDRELKDVFEIQSEVAQNIASVLKTELTPQLAKRINQKPTNNLDAYQYYSQGRYQWELRTRESLNKAIELFEKAIELDSTFALAYAGLGQTYITIGSNNYDLPSIAFPKGKKYAEKTLELNPDLAEAYTTLAAYYYDHDFQFEKALDYFKKSLALKPNDATTHQWLAEAYYAKGDPLNARNEIEIAKQLNPKSLAVQLVDSSISLGENKPERVIERYEMLEKEYPDVFTIKQSLFFGYYETGQPEKAWKYLNKIDPQQKRKYLWIEWYHRKGDYDQLRAMRTKIETEETNPTYKAWLYELIDFKMVLEKGDIESYINTIDTLLFIEKNRNLFNQQSFRPPDSVYQHPKYIDLMKKRGFQLIPRDY